ncbi:1-deoxy-D-xylulose-5-phosphate synthase [Clostridium sp. HMP27]|uniref:1-deoxy-D-xylulose-5-phosphate synthase n=1 Tax=Clostridium sp. HMP27 TaxID=1487921 RepID=UPI00052C78BD|nr:1-deoxy-D-xylulose-5-phosphate synthase [Clostridium sp. HMP27]KGK89043.1 1-deoxy-D-xylulose-5-phosphate synthase [Clostridium sp. HMP27]
MINILNEYKEPNDIKNMTIEELNGLANEIRGFLIENVSRTGGHLASNLGVVELTLSLYNIFNFKKDKIVWDVGHQCYVHKILSGRMSEFKTLRKYGGLSGFPKVSESEYDHFQTGHSSTSISAALGMARARDLKGEKNEVLAVIGDGALTGGMAFEALNDVGYSKTKMIIILNDNQMSIGKNVGGMSAYLSKIRMEPGYAKLKQDIDGILKKIPSIGDSMARTLERVKNGIKQMVVPGMLFENMGIKYLGPIDGHNIKEVSEILEKAKSINGPVIIHIVTKKGKGYKFAEMNPGKFHGIGPFNLQSGEVAVTGGISYSKAFGNAMVKLAEEDDRIVAITAAMKDGTGLQQFEHKYKGRFFDVGIAEQHAVTMAAGMASQGLKPVFAVYSTFLQRAYDQVVHDICIQKLPVILAIDRAGIVGADGETHQGVFDLSYLSHIPNMTIMAPKCVEEMEPMFKWALNQNSPIAIRYPRGGDVLDLNLNPVTEFKYGKWETIYDEGDISIIAVGKMVQNALIAREKLLRMGIKIGVVNAIFVKPIDIELLSKFSKTKKIIITVEDNIVTGGFGSLVSEYIQSTNSTAKVINLGFKDEFIPHGNVDVFYKASGIDSDGIVEKVIKFI